MRISIYCSAGFLTITTSWSGTKKSSRKAASKDAEEKCFDGDRVLANTISFMADACVLEEFNYAIAEGDVGRVYEAMKVGIPLLLHKPSS